MVSAALVLLTSFSLILLVFAGLAWMRSGNESRRRAGSALDFDHFSVDKYRPMERLLGREDAAFLASQPGFRPSMLKRLRTNRVRVVRTYLSEIRADFDGLYAIAREGMLQVDGDVAGLLQMLVRQRIIFYWAFATLEMRVVLYQFGVGGVNFRPVLDLVEAMQHAAQSLDPLAAAA